ncbi:MAG: hypothetical protein OEL20_05075 [Sulfuritalea sp.]|nr:hypothetical protein [Sulfuritalea sp.]
MPKRSGRDKLVEDALQMLEVEAAGFAAAAAGNGDPPPNFKGGDLVRSNWQFGASLFFNSPMAVGGPS